MNYFVDAIDGNDLSSGLSEGQAWKTSNKVSAFNFSEPSTVAYKRGQTFKGQLITKTSVTYTAYGTGEKPIVTVMDKVPNSDLAENWSAVDGLNNVWVLILNPFVNYTPRVFLNGVEYQRAQDKEHVSITKRVCWENSTNQFLYVYSLGNPATYYTSIKGANFSISTLIIENATNVTVSELDVRGSEGGAIDITGGNNITIQNCCIGKDSTRAGVRVNICNGLVVSGNVFDTGERIRQDFNISREGGDGILLGQGNTENVNVYNNTFINWRHSAISIEQTSQGTTFSNVHIHHNTATAPDISYGRAISAYTFDSTGFLVEYNTFTNFPVQNQFAARGLVFTNNTIDTVTNVPYSPYEMGTGIGIQIGHLTYEAQNMQFLNNTIKNCSTTGMQLDGHLANNGGAADVKNNIISGNIFTHNGFDVKNPYYDPTYSPLNTDIIIRDNVDVQNNTFTDNRFTTLLNNRVIYFGPDAQDDYLKTVIEFNAQDGVGGNTISGNQNILIGYFPANFALTNKSLGVAQSVPTDARSWFYDEGLFLGRPYQSVNEALQYLVIPTHRGGHYSVFINPTGDLQPDGTYLTSKIEEWWFKDGDKDSDFVPKTNMNSLYKLFVGTYDPVGKTNLPTNPNGTNAGDWWYVSNAGAVQGITMNKGDILLARIDGSSPTNSNHWKLLRNEELATETKAGIVVLATTDQVLYPENIFSPNSQDNVALAVTPFTLRDRLLNILSQGTNVTITGTGTPDDPWVINSTASGGGLNFANADLTFTGEEVRTHHGDGRILILDNFADIEMRAIRPGAVIYLTSFAVMELKGGGLDLLTPKRVGTSQSDIYDTRIFIDYGDEVNNKAEIQIRKSYLNFDANVASTYATGGKSALYRNNTTGNIERIEEISASAVLSFPQTSPSHSSDLTIAVAGAALNDIVDLGIPAVAMTAGGTFVAFVSAANEVTVRFINTTNIGDIVPAANSTYKVRVRKD